MRIREFQQQQPDIHKIRIVAGNKKLQLEHVFDFGSFVIAKSGVNRNHTDISAEAQRLAAERWIGKAILFRDHESTTDNQIGRIYDAWTEDRQDGTYTLGRGYGIKTEDTKDIFARIESGIHREMSCAYDPTKSICSQCQSELTGDRLMSCPQGHEIGRDGVHAIDLEFMPDHVSFVARPAVDGAGLVAAGDQNKLLRIFRELGDEPEQAIRDLKRDAEDGRAYRSMIADEFAKWFGLAHPDSTDEEIRNLAAKLSAKEMCNLARIERERVHEMLPNGGRQMTVAATEQDGDAITTPEFTNIQDIFRKGNRSCQQ